MKTLRIPIAVLLAVLLLPSFAFAQTNDWAAVKNVAVGTKLKVKLKNGKTREGQFSSATDDALVLNIKTTAMKFDRADIQTVHQRGKGSATAATLIGMGVGAGAGAAIGAAGSDNDSFDKINHAATVGLAVVGAVVGAGVGYLIGRGNKKQVLLYQVK